MNTRRMESTPGPYATWERAHGFVREYDLGGFAETFATDGVLELPFAPPGWPNRVEGRENIRRLLEPAGDAARRAGRRILGYSSVVVHETADPEVIVVEFDLEGVVASSGRRYTLSYIQVVRVRDGEIVHFRDYIDPRALSSAAGAEDRSRAGS